MNGSCDCGTVALYLSLGIVAEEQNSRPNYITMPLLAVDGMPRNVRRGTTRLTHHATVHHTRGHGVRRIALREFGGESLNGDGEI